MDKGFFVLAGPITLAALETVWFGIHAYHQLP